MKDNFHICLFIWIFFIFFFCPVCSAQTKCTLEDRPEWIDFQYPPCQISEKTDPFLSFIELRKYELMQDAEQARSQKKETPLETVDIQNLHLVGIVNAGEKTWAMIEMPDGKGYLVSQGTRMGIYDGVVKTIAGEMLVVEEQVKDILGSVTLRQVEMKLRQNQE